MDTDKSYPVEKFFYTVSGNPDGQPAILMHGWGCTHTTVAFIERVLTGNGLKVFNVDFPGFGNSPEPGSVWGVEEYTSLIEELCRRENIESPVLVGHSFGGRVAILFASRNRTEKVVLVDAAGVKPSRSFGYYLKVYRFKAYKRLVYMLLGKEKGEKYIEKARLRKGSADYASASPRMRAILSKVVNEDLCNVMPDIKAPTLLIYGENDTATPVRDAKKIESLVAGSGLVVIKNAGHYSFLDAPGQFSAVMDSFMKS